MIVYGQRSHQVRILSSAKCISSFPSTSLSHDTRVVRSRSQLFYCFRVILDEQRKSLHILPARATGSPDVKRDLLQRRHLLRLRAYREKLTKAGFDVVGQSPAFLGGCMHAGGGEKESSYDGSYYITTEEMMRLQREL